MNKKFSEIIASSVEFRAKTWEQLQSAFPNASYLQNKFITSDNVYFVLSSQFNSRLPLWEEQEFLGYFNLQVLKGLENLSFSMGLWLDTTIETTISDPSKRGATRSSVLSGVNETFSKANDFSDIATPISGESTIANQTQNTSTANNTDTALDFITNIQNLYSAELSSKWTFFLKEFNWLFQQVFSYAPQDNTSSNIPNDIQAQIDAINEKIEEIVNFANALNTQVQANKSDINGIKQEITTEILPDILANAQGIKALQDLPIQTNTQGALDILANVKQDNPLITKNAMSGGAGFTPTQANIYPVIKPMLKGAGATTITPADATTDITISSTDTQPSLDNIYPIDKLILKAGANILIDGDDTAKTLTISADKSQFTPTQENIYPATKPMLKAGNNITINTDDNASFITINAASGTGDPLKEFTSGTGDAQNNTRILASPSATENMITLTTPGVGLSSIVLSPGPTTLTPEKLNISGGTNESIEFRRDVITYTPPTGSGAPITKDWKDLINSGGSFTPTQENIYPTVKPMIIAGNNITVTPSDAGESITIASSVTPTDPTQVFSSGTNGASISTRVINSAGAGGLNPGTATFTLTDENTGGVNPSIASLVLGSNDSNSDATTLVMSVANGGSGKASIEGVYKNNSFFSLSETQLSTGAVKMDQTGLTFQATSKAWADILAPNPTPFNPSQAALYPYVKPIFLAGTNISLVPADGTNNITINSTGGGGGFTPTQGNIYPTVKPMLKAGTGMTITPDDTGTTLTFASTGGAAEIKWFEPDATWADIYAWAITNQGQFFYATPNGTSPYGLGQVTSVNGATINYSFMWDGKYMTAQQTSASNDTKGPIISMLYGYADLKGMLLAGTNVTISPNDTTSKLTINANVSQSLLYPFLKTMLVGSNGLVITPKDSDSTITLDTSTLANAVGTNTSNITKINATKITANGNVFNIGSLPSTDNLTSQSYVDTRVVEKGAWINQTLTNFVITEEMDGKRARFTYSDIRYEGYIAIEPTTSNQSFRGEVLTGQADSQISISRLYAIGGGPDWTTTATFMQQVETYSDPAKPQRQLTNTYSKPAGAKISKIEVWI